MMDTSDTTIPPQRSLMSQENVEDDGGEMKKDSSDTVTATPLEAIVSDQQSNVKAEDQGHCLPSQGVGGTELMDEGAQRTDVSGAEAKRPGAMGGPETRPGVPPKRKPDHCSLHFGATGRVPDGGREANRKSREEFPPLVASDGDECQPSQTLRSRKKQRTDIPYMQRMSRSRSTARRKSPDDIRRENLSHPT
jgi:hypothetical protein